MVATLGTHNEGGGASLNPAGCSSRVSLVPVLGGRVSSKPAVSER